MATWTTIPDANLDPGKPARSIDALALRDNPIAIAEGAAGAPQIVNSAITNGTIGSEKFQTGDTERDWVLARTAAASVGAVGTYALLWRDGATTTPGSTASGGGLKYASAFGDFVSSPAPSGTWRLMGYSFQSSDSSREVSVWLRIS